MNNLCRYDWELDGQRAEFSVDLSYAEQFDMMGDFTTLLVIAISPAELRESASFTARESKKYKALLRRLSQLLGQKGIHVGTILLDAHCRFYFYTSDARLLVPVYDQCGKTMDLKVECQKFEDPDHETYFRLLYPDPAKRQAADNAVYIKSLLQRGDDANAYRRINLHFFFPTAQTRILFERDAKQMGFAVGDIGFIPEREPSHYISIHIVSKLFYDDVTEQTTKAIYAADRYHGVMDHLDSAFVAKRKTVLW